ncbi:PepSY-associated TM helix domain-containing protein [Chitinophaga sp. YIM B06452]|uniref:PepSY-associated TM helix domain-containing protein n=1 Tax=Chitinophaga sp. YIM B06452 TaxID=3082158 RepID=UPI0031FE8073
MTTHKKKKWRWAQHQKRWFGKWHLYVGIIAGAILCIVGLTGSILVFQDEIDIALNRELFETLKGQKRYAIQEIIPVVQQKYPGRKFDYVFQTDETNPNATYRFFQFKTEEEFFVNPYTGELCGKRLTDSAFIRIVMNIHRTLLIPAAGRYIVGLAALCMLILTISGLRMWVPQQYRKWKQWRSVLTVNFKAGLKRQNYDWHNVLGFYSSPVIILLSLTGFAITFSTVFISFLFMLTGKSPQSVASIFAQKSQYAEGARSLTAAEVAAIAAKTAPYGQLLGIAVPTTKDMVYRLDMKSEGPARTGNRIMLFVDQYTGKVLLNSENDFPNIGNSYLSWLTPLHYGTFGGMPTRILALIGGLIPVLLYITGFIIWWPRHKKQQRKPAAPEKPVVKVYMSYGKCFSHYFKKGLKYAALLLVCSLLAGALYGLISGIVVQPALFSVLYTGISICVNFIIALLACIICLLLLGPFRRYPKRVHRYFALSLAFLLVFLPVIILIAQLNMKVF